ncbi:hypothetical protein WN943_027309 [Citrus x changshan-huyou]
MEVHNRTTTSRLQWKFFVVISTNDDVFGLNFCSLFSVLQQELESLLISKPLRPSPGILLISVEASERVKLSNGSFSRGCGGLRMVATRSMKERGTRRTKEQLPSEGSAIRRDPSPPFHRIVNLVRHCNRAAAVAAVLPQSPFKPLLGKATDVLSGCLGNAYRMAFLVKFIRGYLLLLC